MTGIEEGVLASLIANAVTAVATRIIPKVQDWKERDKSLRESLGQATDLEKLIGKAIKPPRSSSILRLGLQDRVSAFLSSPEAISTVRQIFSSRLAPEDRNADLDSIRSLFKSTLLLHIGEEARQLGTYPDRLFDTLVNACERALEAALEKGLLSAHEAKSASRHRGVLGELTAIKKNLALLTRLAVPGAPNRHEILEFEEKYRGQVGSRHAYITPPNFDEARKIPIDDLYVAPTIVRPPRGKDETPLNLSVEEFIITVHRGVVLGNPGSGKSTLVY